MPIKGLPFEFVRSVMPVPEAIELNTDMLITAIDIQSRFLPQSEIVQKFYDGRENGIDDISGPRLAEHETKTAGQISVASPNYPLPFLVIAPPVILQTRKEQKPCSKDSWGSKFLDQAAHVVLSSVCVSDSKTCPWLNASELIQCQRNAVNRD